MGTSNLSLMIDCSNMSCFHFLYRLSITFHCGGHVLPVVHPPHLLGNSLQVSFLWEENDEESRTHPCSVSVNCPACLPHWANNHFVVVWLLHSTLPQLGLSAKQPGHAFLHHCSAPQHHRSVVCDHCIGCGLGNS